MLTKEEKICVLNRAIDLLSLHLRNFMCTAIEYAASELYGFYIKATIAIPEILKYKPCVKGDVWFPAEERKRRIEILKLVILDIIAEDDEK